MSNPTNIQIPQAFAPLFDPQYRDYAFYGGRGGAKTHSVASALTIQAAQSPLRIVCAREIQNSIRDSSKAVIEDKIREHGLSRHFVITDQEIRGATKANEDTRFIFKGMWRNPDAIKSLEGADIFWGDEANRFSARSIRLVRPTMRKPGSRMIWTWNPEFDHDPIDQLFRSESGPPPNSLVCEVSWRDNPWFKNTPLMQEMEHDYASNPQMAQHVWGGGYVTAIEGAYFAQALGKAREEGRIGSVAPDPLLRKRAVWDIGVSDSTAIWIVQWVGKEILVLDYIEGQGQPLGYYVHELRSRGHGDSVCILPHDGAHRNAVTAERYEDHVRDAGFEVQVIRNQGKGAAMLRIEAARRLFDRISFDEDKCREGLKALSAYHERRDEKRNAGLGPEHDWSSHASDSFGLMCVAYEEPIIAKRKASQRPTSWMS